MLRLDFLKDTILVLQVGIHFRRVFQNEGDRPVDLSQRTYGWISSENGLRRAPAPEVVGQSVETNTCSGDIVAAIMDLDLLVCGHHDNRATPFYSDGVVPDADEAAGHAAER
jgi:hypothetical protein